jgi:hypothetical protein
VRVSSSGHSSSLEHDSSIENQFTLVGVSFIELKQRMPLGCANCQKKVAG